MCKSYANQAVFLRILVASSQKEGKIVRKVFKFSSYHPAHRFGLQQVCKVTKLDITLTRLYLRVYILFFFLPGKKNEIWFSVVTWLLRHNAEKLVFIDTEPNEYDVDQFLKRFHFFLQNYKNVSLMHLPNNTADSPEDSLSTLQTLSKFTQVDLVFCISLV